MRYTVSLFARLLVTGSQAAKPVARPAAKAPAFNVFEASISDMPAAIKSGRATSHEIVQQYLTRIATYEDLLHAAITVNPKALAEADALDRERALGHVRGLLHGIAIALEDNIHTTNMPTTGGALALVGTVPPYEATLTKNLHAARDHAVHAAGTVPAAIRIEAAAGRGRRHRLRLQRADAAATRVRIRAGNKEEDGAARTAVREQRWRDRSLVRSVFSACSALSARDIHVQS